MRSHHPRAWLPLVALCLLTGCGLLRPGGRGAKLSPGQQPAGEAIPALSRAQCRELLTARGVAFQDVPWSAARGVEIPIQLGGELGGLRLTAQNSTPGDAVMDCRLAVALLGWTEGLRARGVSELVALSLYRPYARVRGRGLQSGHARGLAIDVGRIKLDSGEVLDVGKTWTDKRHGAPPCKSGPRDSQAARKLRALTCLAVDARLFQVVLTPHADADHHNHVHLEVRPDLASPCIR